MLTPHSACIAYETTILTEATLSASSHASSLASLALPKIDHSKAQKATYAREPHHIHYLASSASEYPDDEASAGRLTYLVISPDKTLYRATCFEFLTTLRTRFLARFPPEKHDFSNFLPYGCAEFEGELRKLMAEYGQRALDVENNGGDSINNVQRDIEDVRGIMSRNIEGLLERGERIDLLVDKTDRLGGSAREFRLRSRGLKRKMWWKNVKLMGLLGFVVVLILLTIVTSVKGGV